jgi:hypothetical protein
MDCSTVAKRSALGEKPSTTLLKAIAPQPGTTQSGLPFGHVL